MIAGLPPGPGFGSTIRFARRPLAFLEECGRRYGDWFTIRVPGVLPFVFTSEPAAVEQVFGGDPALLRAGEANQPLAAFMGPHSLLFLDGAEHRRERRLLLPPFHGERMHAYAAVMREVVDRAIDRWPVGRRFPIHHALREVTFEVILRTVFGLGEGPFASQLRDRLIELFALFASPAGAALGIPALQIDLGPWTPWGRAVRLRRDVERLLYAEFARRRAEASDGRTNVLSLLLTARDERGEPMSDAVLRDEMLTLLLAGHETTAATLAWALHRLVAHPDVVEGIRCELSDVLDGARLEAMHVGELRYLDAVLREVTRLDPVIPNVGRHLATAMRLGSRDLPAGCVVAPCIHLVHRRPDLWPDPERFDPGRFLDGRPTAAVFLPFGGGVRRCLGAAFATYEMKVVLAEILARVELAPAPGYRARAVRRGIAIAPSGGLPLVVRGRRPSS